MAKITASLLTAHCPACYYVYLIKLAGLTPKQAQEQLKQEEEQKGKK